MIDSLRGVPYVLAPVLPVGAAHIQAPEPRKPSNVPRLEPWKYRYSNDLHLGMPYGIWFVL